MTTPPASPGSGRLPALDGIRALAVAAVLAFHGGVTPLARGGFLGVDAFFVLSGCLITGLLLAEHDRSGRIRLARFWARRARRLLPALLVVIAVVVAVFRSQVPPEELPLLRIDALATLGYAANWWLLHRADGGYFAATAGASPLQHTWSLAIEEQFYVLWPLVILACLWLARRPARAILVVSGAGIAASAVAMGLLVTPADPSRVYYGSDTRAASLLAGCALAVLLRRASLSRAQGWALTGASVAAVAGLGWAWTHATGSAPWLYRGGLLACAVAAAVVIAAAMLTPRGPVARLLSAPPLPQAGLISYGIYLWHWPVFEYLTGERTGRSGAALFGLRCAVTLALAAASYVLVERPIRTGAWLVRPRLRPAVALGAATAVAALAVACTVPPPPPAEPAPIAVAALPQPARPSRAAGDPAARPAPSLLTRPGRIPGPPRIAFFGDSVGRSLGDSFPAMPGMQVASAALQGCGISPSGLVRDGGSIHGPYPKCPRWEEYWKAGLRVHHPDVAVVLTGRWEVMDRKLAGQWRPVTDPLVREYLSGQLDRMIALLSAGGTRVVLCTFPYSRRHERPDGGLYPEDRPDRIDAWNRLIAEAAVRHRGTVTIAGLAARMDPQGRYVRTIDGIGLRSDGLHLTGPAVRRWIAPWLAPQLRMVLAGPPSYATGQ